MVHVRIQRRLDIANAFQTTQAPKELQAGRCAEQQQLFFAACAHSGHKNAQRTTDAANVLLQSCIFL